MNQEGSNKSEPRFSMNSFPSVPEILMASWNYLGWWFEGRSQRREQSDGMVYFQIEGRTAPIYWSPVFWIHFVIAYIFKCRFLLTRKGRENFNMYYHMFLTSQESTDTVIYDLQGIFSSESNGASQKLYMFTSKYTRISCYLMDLNKYCDEELHGDIWRYFGFVLVTFLSKPVHFLFDTIPSFISFVIYKVIAMDLLDRTYTVDELSRKVNAPTLSNITEKMLDDKLYPVVYIPLGVIMWILIFQLLYMIFF